MAWKGKVVRIAEIKSFLFKNSKNRVKNHPFTPAILALASLTVVLADARPAAWLALAASAIVLADDRPAALLAPASYAVVLADARPAALLALASWAVMLADARPAAWLAHVSSAVVLADARPAACVAPAFLAVVLADARPAAWLALAPLAVVWALWTQTLLFLSNFAACRSTAHPFFLNYYLPPLLFPFRSAAAHGLVFFSSCFTASFSSALIHRRRCQQRDMTYICIMYRVIFYTIYFRDKS
jgi:hypothetical protein